MRAKDWGRRTTWLRSRAGNVLSEAGAGTKLPAMILPVATFWIWYAPAGGVVGFAAKSCWPLQRRRSAISPIRAVGVAYLFMGDRISEPSAPFRTRQNEPSQNLHQHRHEQTRIVGGER